MVSILREKFAHLNLTFSIGGQISFDVSIVNSYIFARNVNFGIYYRITEFRYSHKAGTKPTA